MFKMLLPCLLLFSNLNATIFFPLDTTTVVNAELSSRFQNRIAVNGERISKVIHPECDIDIVLENDIGQLFVYSLINCPEKTTISVVTEGGWVQDIELSFRDKPSEIVILDPVCFTEEVYEQDAVDSYLIGPGHPDYMVMVVEGVRSGTVPEGFVACDITPECRKVKKVINAVLVSKLVSLEETVYVWRVENHSRWNQTIYEKEMNFQCGSWVYLDKNKLGPGEQVIGIVGVKNYAQR